MSLNTIWIIDFASCNSSLERGIVDQASSVHLRTLVRVDHGIDPTVIVLLDARALDDEDNGDNKDYRSGTSDNHVEVDAEGEAVDA